MMRSTLLVLTLCVAVTMAMPTPTIEADEADVATNVRAKRQFSIGRGVKIGGASIGPQLSIGAGGVSASRGLHVPGRTSIGRQFSIGPGGVHASRGVNIGK